MLLSSPLLSLFSSLALFQSYYVKAQSQSQSRSQSSSQSQSQDQVSSSTLTSSQSSSTESSESQLFPSITAFSNNNGISYNVNGRFGSDDQDILLRVDIAQPFIWVISSDKTCINSTNNSCITNGVYNSSSSNSSTDILDDQDFVFLNGISLNGSIVNDDAEILNFNNNSGFNMPGLNFISANDSVINVGAFGLAGKIYDQALSNLPNNTFLDYLNQENLINSSSYSFFPINNEFLKLTFGGLNPNEYINDLVQFDNIPYRSHNNDQLYYNYPIIAMTGISVVSNTGSIADLPYRDTPVLLDSRFTYSLLPFETIISLAVQLNAYYSADDNFWLVKCSTGDLNASLSFKFGNVTIKVPISNFLRELLYDDNNRQVVFDDGDPACFLSVLSDNSYGYSILGTNFLKSAYLAVDNDNQKIAIAQAYNEFYTNLTEKQSQSQKANTTKVTTIDYPIESLAIQSGIIPNAVPNNVTNYDRFTFAFTSRPASSAIPDDITAGVIEGTIYTGRIGTSGISNSIVSQTASARATMEAGGYQLRNDIGFTLFGCFLSLLSLLI